MDYSLYLVTDRRFMGKQTLAEAVEQAILGGCTMVQLREKELSSLDFYWQAIKIKQITDSYHIPLIINDRVDIAMAVQADGVHIGQHDIPAAAVRKMIGIISHQSSFSVSAVVWTVLGFMLVQAIALFILGGRLCRQEIHQLLYGEIAKKQKVGKTGGSIVTLILGTVLLLFAYWLVLNHFMAAGGAMLFLAVLLGIMGTILFIRGLARLLSLLAGSNKKKSTQGLYTFTLRQLQENIVNKFVSISVASLLMMLTIMLIADGSVRIMSSSDQLTRGASVYDFTISGEDQTVEQYLTSEKMAPYVSHVNRMETGVMKRPDGGLSSYMDWSLLRREIVHALPSNVEDPATQGAVSYEIDADNPAALNLLALIDTSGSAPYLLRASSYNQLLEASGEDTLTLNDIGRCG